MSASNRAPRRAGSPWRILAHEWLGRKGETLYGRSFHVGNDPKAAGRGTEATILEGTELDEVVVGRWLWAEQMDAGVWHIVIGGVVVTVRADRDGRPKRVSVYGPGDYDGPAEGCEYDLTWTAGP